MMESKQMPEHRGFSFWNLEYDDGDDGFVYADCLWSFSFGVNG